MDDIARQRNLQPSTVERHLERFIASGELGLDEIVPLEKIEAIQTAVLLFKDQEALTPVKEHLGDDYSWGEIRAVLAAIAGRDRR